MQREVINDKAAHSQVGVAALIGIPLRALSSEAPAPRATRHARAARIVRTGSLQAVGLYRASTFQASPDSGTSEAPHRCRDALPRVLQESHCGPRRTAREL